MKNKSEKWLTRESKVIKNSSNSFTLVKFTPWGRKEYQAISFYNAVALNKTYI